MRYVFVRNEYTVTSCMILGKNSKYKICVLISFKEKKVNMIKYLNICK